MVRIAGAWIEVAILVLFCLNYCHLAKSHCRLDVSASSVLTGKRVSSQSQLGCVGLQEGPVYGLIGRRQSRCRVF